MSPFKSLDPLLHSQLRLAVMSLLMNCEFAEFTYLKDNTKATSGNLSIQLEKLENADYVKITKGYKGKRPLTTVRVTETGRKAFRKYFEDLQSYFK